MTDSDDDLIGVLVGDVAAVHADLVDHDSPHGRRSLVRAVLSAIEGLNWHLKDSLRHSSARWSPSELQFLADEAYTVEASGKIREITKFNPLEHSVKAIHRLARKLKEDVAIDFEGAGWNSMISSIQVRNRITHPKTFEQLSISHAEVECCMKAFNWFIAFAMRVMQARYQAADPRASNSTFTLEETQLLERLDALSLFARDSK